MSKGSKRRPGNISTDQWMRAMGWAKTELDPPGTHSAEFRRVDGVLYWRLLKADK